MSDLHQKMHNWCHRV